MNLGTFFCSIIILQMTTNYVPNCSKFFSCENCNYYTSRKSQYDRHFLTSKHQNTMVILQNTTNLVQKVPEYTCENCNKIYKHHSSLWNHKKKCTNLKNNDISTNEDKQKDELINYLIKENQEFKSLILEIVKKDTITNNNITNNNNKTFNLNVFLNETCKDAMNIMDFVDSIKLQLSDLEKIGKIGYVEGISDIITTNLKALDVTQRPIHCTDNKREVLYVKDDDKWEKEAEKKEKIRKVIKNVAHKNIKMLQSYKNIHPDCLKSESKYSDQYNKIVIESFGGHGDNDIEKENKIIKNIAKGVIIDK